MHLSLGQHFCAAHYALNQTDTAAADLINMCRHLKTIIQQRGFEIIQFDRAHHEHHAEFLHQSGVAISMCAQPLSPRAFHKVQIIGMIDHAARISVLEIHSHRQ